MENKINLDQIYHKHFDGLYYDDLTDKMIKNFAIDFGKQLLELAAENAEITMLDEYLEDGVEINKQSILDTINQIE